MKMKAVLKLFKDTYRMKKIVIGNGYITKDDAKLLTLKYRDIKFEMVEID